MSALQTGLTPLGIFVFRTLAALVLESGKNQRWLIAAVTVLRRNFVLNISSHHISQMSAYIFVNSGQIRVRAK
jgi:hypothetical protein